MPFTPFTDITVKLIDEDQLPKDHMWALVRQQKSESEPPRKWLFVKRTATPWLMAHIAEQLRRNHLAS